MVCKVAYFRFEASTDSGAGHAIRSGVIADELLENGWDCRIVTSKNTYDFIPKLERFKRVNPDLFYASPVQCDLFVIDNYNLDIKYERYFRTFAKKIMVIDDLANRKHDCDILLDQTFGRDASDYKTLVPENCQILVGSDYVLLRKDFRALREKALEKRARTTQIKRILISMGGSDPENHTRKALQELKNLGYKGAIDIVLGFQPTHLDSINHYIKALSNDCMIHIDADMPNLTYTADLAIGAAGSSVWERCCLGLPMVLMLTANNQEKIYENLRNMHAAICLEQHESLLRLPCIAQIKNLQRNSSRLCDGLGINLIMEKVS